MKITLSFVELTMLLIMGNLIVFAFYLFLLKGAVEKGHIYLGLFFLSLAINIFHMFMLRLPAYFIHFAPFLFYIGAPFAFMYAPCLYLYIRKLTCYNANLKFIDALHLLPFILFVFYLALHFYFLPLAKRIEMVKNHDVIEHSYWIIIMSMLHLQILYYIIRAIVQIRKYNIQIRNIFSSIEKRKSLSWLKFFFFCIVILWLVDVTRFFIYVLNPHMIQIIESVLFVVFLFMSYLILYKVMNYSPAFSLKNSENRKNSLSASSSEKYLKKLLRYMEMEKPYMDPNISLMDLGQQVGIPHRSLSEVINNALQQNFYDFINSYRVRESERLLKESEQYKTVLEVLYEVGFNSKSAFHTAFKKTTGMTPTQFKRVNGN